MRKLILGAFVSLDGVIEKPWEWIGNYFDEEGKHHASAKLDEADIFLLGRKTYEKFSATWPNIKGDFYMDRINAISKRVVSGTLKQVGWNTEIIKTDPEEAIGTLKKQPGKNIIKYGIGQLDGALLRSGLIDEFEFSIIPIKVGKGKRLFEDIDISGIRLNLKSSKTFKNGVALLTYAPGTAD
jgi:dihydrofolate reductase